MNIIPHTYKSINELPLQNYINIQMRNDLKYLLKLDIHTRYIYNFIGEKELNILAECWQLVKDEILDFTGISENYSTALQKERDIALLKAHIIINNDASKLGRLQHQVEMYKDFIQQNEEVSNKFTIYDQCALIEKYIGSQFDLKNTTVAQWLSYNKMFTQSLKPNKNE